MADDEPVPFLGLARTGNLYVDQAAFIAAMEAGAPWWLAMEAASSTRLDRDPDVGTHEVK